MRDKPDKNPNVNTGKDFHPFIPPNVRDSIKLTTHIKRTILPLKSKRLLPCILLSFSESRAINMEIKPIGTLAAKMDLHPKVSTRTPPARDPMSIPNRPIPDIKPRAFPHSYDGKALVTKAGAEATNNPLPTACSTRRPITNDKCGVILINKTAIV